MVYAVVNGDIQGIRRRNPNGVDEIITSSGQDTVPRYSPDGRWISFARLEADGSTNLWVSDLKDEETTQVISLTADIDYEWAPDSKTIAVVSEISGGQEIWTLAPDGRTQKQLTSNRVEDRSPRGSADGDSMLFLSKNNVTFNLYSMKKNGDDQQRIPQSPEAIIDADW